MLLLFFAGIVTLGFWGALSRWPNLLASLLYQHNLIYGAGSVINTVAWTLEVEVQFYLLAPFLAIVFSIRDIRWRRAAILAAVVGPPMLRSFAPAQYYLLLLQSVVGQLEFFAAGFLLAELFLIDWKQKPSVSLKWDLASVVGWAGLVTLMLLDRWTILLAPCVLLAYIGAFRGRISNRLFRVPQLTVVGGMCYSMYLLHAPVISVIGRFANRIPFGSTFSSRLVVEAAFAVPAVLAVTFLYFILIERPCMDPSWPFKIAQCYRAWTGASPIKDEPLQKPSV
jgi:peptidoglycan/LPS O-acetylase OafA/YrhL